jgi:hypothetical protein
MSGNILPWWSDLWCMNQTIPYSLDTRSLSALEILNKLVLAVDGIINDANVGVDQIKQMQEQIAELDDLLHRIADGEYAELYIDQLASYIDKNLIMFVARLVKYVFPGFYWDGDCWRLQFVMPSNWDFLNFKFVWNQDDFSYHIELEY